MITTYLFDFSRVLLFPKDKSYTGELNTLYRDLTKRGVSDFWEYYEWNEQLLSYLEGIKDKIGLYVFTSGLIQDAPELKGRLNKVFKKVYSSEKLGLNKKESDSFVAVAKDIGVQPENILFIDDSETNIKAAKQANVNVLLYRDYGNLMMRLNEILSIRN